MTVHFSQLFGTLFKKREKGKRAEEDRRNVDLAGSLVRRPDNRSRLCRLAHIEQIRPLLKRLIFNDGRSNISLFGSI